MSRTKKKGLQGKKKWMIIAGVVAALALVGLFFWKFRSTQSNEANAEPYQLGQVVEGTLASSTLLSGTVKAQSEQYVYFDSSKGSNPRVTVSLGQQVTAGQQLVQYDTTSAQATYDQAVRNLNKVGRQINELKTNGVVSSSAASSSAAVDASDGGAGTDVSSSQATATSYQDQLQDLNDAYANAQDEVNKAADALNNTVIVSDVDGTVVEVNNDIDPSGKDSKALVHIASEGRLEIEGSLTEYDLANIKEGQAVKIKSKVYPDQEWQGKISQVSNYPNQATASSTGTGTGQSSAASYNYTVEITSELKDLKQGFTVSVEVVNDKTSLLLPSSAIVNEDDKYYVWVYDKSNSRVLKKEVTVGDADATSQEITSGLDKDQEVIINPDDKLVEGEKIDQPQGGAQETTEAQTEAADANQTTEAEVSQE